MAAQVVEESEKRPVVLVVDDDTVVREGLVDRLRSEGFEALSAVDGNAAEQAVRSLQPDLVVLDLNLPGISGFELLRTFQKGGPPVIILSGLDSETDRVLGLEMGADDYVTKPFSTREIAVRARRLYERTQQRVDQTTDVFEGSISGVALQVDFRARRVSLGGADVSLRPREFDLLAYFIQNPRQVLTKPQLLNAVWAAEVGWVGEATVTEHVRRLRTKLKLAETEASPIDTLWGVGYRFEPVV